MSFSPSKIEPSEIKIGEYTKAKEGTLEHFKMHLLRKYPFYGNVIAYITLSLTTKLTPTAGIYIDNAGSINILFNPKFFDKLTLEEKVAVFEHEIMHLVCGHLTHRLYAGDKDMWNQAYDIAINCFIDGLPKGSVAHDSFKFDMPKFKTCEWYFARLKENIKKIYVTFSNCNCKGNGQGGGISIDGDCNGDCNGDCQGDCKGKYKVTFTDKDGNKYTFDGIDDHTEWSKVPSEMRDTFEEYVKYIFSEAKNKTRDYGKESGHIMSAIEHFIKSITPWEKVLRMFARKLRSSKRSVSWKKTNRRFEHPTGARLPGFKKIGLCHIVLGLDTSGSISDTQLAAFAGEIERIHQGGTKITVIECDAAVQDEYDYRSISDLKFKGRGGTSFIPVFKRAKELKCDGVVYLTDGDGSYPDESLKIPTIWALTHGVERDVPFGAKILIPEYN